VPAIPDRHAPRGRTRVDAGVVDPVKFPGEAIMRPGPQGLHHPHLLRRALAAVAEVLVEADELDLVPADADPELEPTTRQLIE
jgi:hypothetical protein